MDLAIIKSENKYLSLIAQLLKKNQTAISQIQNCQFCQNIIREMAVKRRSLLLTAEKCTCMRIQSLISVDLK